MVDALVKENNVLLPGPFALPCPALPHQLWRALLIGGGGDEGRKMSPRKERGMVPTGSY